MFRGYLQPSLIRHLGLAGGIAVTALVFAAWHPPFFSVPGFLVRLSLGLITGALRGRDRPLIAAIAAHTPAVAGGRAQLSIPPGCAIPRAWIP